MTDQSALLAALADAPEDDALHLVYADWLEEQGADPDRAELVRVQVDLARLPPSHPRYPELHLRQLDLLAARERDWLGEWADSLVRWEFRRGVLNAVTVLPEVFAQHGADLFARHPVQRVALVNEEGESLQRDRIAEVVAAPAMGRVRALELSGCKPDEPMAGMYGGSVETSAWLKALAGADHLTRLEAVDLNGSTRSGRGPITQEAWKAFCSAAHLHGLRRLDLSDAYAPNHSEAVAEIIHRLGRATFSPSLRALSLDGIPLPRKALEALAKVSLPALEGLDLAGCAERENTGGRLFLTNVLSQLTAVELPSARAMREFAVAPSFPRLRSLRLGELWPGPPHGPADVAALLAPARLPNLERLTLAFEDVEEAALAGLLSAPWLGRLRELHVLAYVLGDALEAFAPLLSLPVEGPTPLHTLTLPAGNEGGQALARWPGLSGLRDLSFDNQSSDETLPLLRLPHLSPRLARLSLSDSCPTAECVRQVASTPALRGLRWLDFGYNLLTRETVTALIASPHLRHLEALHLGSESGYRRGTPDEAEAALLLLAAPTAFPHLRDVVVGTGTPAPAITALRRRFGPRLRVWQDY